MSSLCKIKTHLSESNSEFRLKNLKRQLICCGFVAKYKSTNSLYLVFFSKYRAGVKEDIFLSKIASSVIASTYWWHDLRKVSPDKKGLLEGLKVFLKNRVRWNLRNSKSLNKIHFKTVNFHFTQQIIGSWVTKRWYRGLNERSGSML